MRTSRRDDIIGAFFLAVFLMNGGAIPDIDWPMIRNKCKEERHMIIKNAKDKDSLTYYCRGECKNLYPLA